MKPTVRYQYARYISIDLVRSLQQRPLVIFDYIESLEDYIKIHLSTGKPVLTLMSLKKVLEKLPEDKFQRIHRSYIVPVAKVMCIEVALTGNQYSQCFVV